MQSIEARTLALAGVMQTAYLVDRIARTGQGDTAAINSMLHSLFVFDSDEPDRIYGHPRNLQLGLRVLRDTLAGHNRDEYRSCVRYALGMLQLQKKLEGEPKAQTTIRNRLQHTEKKLEHFTQDINEIASSIAAIYQDTISHFNYRIQVSGSIQQLQISTNADRIRSLLLAGIRSAWLWRRLGGRRWQLLTQRNALLKTANALISR
jgi:high frequency lysogenization protein